MLVLVETNDLGSALLYFGIFLAMLYIATGRLSFRPRGLRAVPRRRLRGRPGDRTRPRADHDLAPSVDDPEGVLPVDGHHGTRQDCQSYQLVKSLYSIANGGFGGTGLGKGTFTATNGRR